jgi:hypothetical protein
LWWTRKRRSGYGDFEVLALPMVIVGQNIAIAAVDLLFVFSALSQAIAPVVAI